MVGEVMTRWACVYEDGSMSVAGPGYDLERARLEYTDEGRHGERVVLAQLQIIVHAEHPLREPSPLTLRLEEATQLVVASPALDPTDVAALLDEARERILELEAGR